MMKMLIGLVLVLVLLSGCIFLAVPIADIKDDSYVGKEVIISGNVEGTIKIGDLSGYTLKDETGSIGVYSVNLPEEGTNKRVKGTVRKVPLLGYYLEE